MSKKNQKKSNVKSSILVLLLIAILLIASTYAWFTANTKVTISTLDVNVKAQNGLQISADGADWKTILQNTDIDPNNVSATYSGNTNQIPTIMEPVSSVGEIATDGTMNMFYGTVTQSDTGTSQLTASKTTDTKGAGDKAGQYIVFDTFLRVDADSQLTLTAESNVKAKDEANSKGLENAARVAFCVLGNTSTGDTLTNIQALNDKATATSYIWEPNYDVHTSAAINNAKNVYNITTTKGPDATKLDYNGIKAAITTPVALNSNNAESFSQVTTIPTKKAMTDTAILNLKAGITKVRIYMWVEGQDVDCENSASGSDIQYNIQFSIPSPTP